VLEVAGPTSQYALFDLAAVPNHFVTISNQGPEHFVGGFDPLKIAKDNGYKTAVIDAKSMVDVDPLSLDAVLVSSMNTNPVTYREIGLFLAEANRVLRPGGVLVLQGVDPFGCRDVEWAMFGNTQFNISGGYMPIAFTTHEYHGEHVIYAVNLVKP